MPNISDSSSEKGNMREDIVQRFASDSDVDATGHNSKDNLNERPNTRSAASTIVATNSQSGGPGKSEQVKTTKNVKLYLSIKGEQQKKKMKKQL